MGETLLVLGSFRDCLQRSEALVVSSNLAAGAVSSWRLGVRAKRSKSFSDALRMLDAIDCELEKTKFPKS